MLNLYNNNKTIYIYSNHTHGNGFTRFNITNLSSVNLSETEPFNISTTLTQNSMITQGQHIMVFGGYEESSEHCGNNTYQAYDPIENIHFNLKLPKRHGNSEISVCRHHNDIFMFHVSEGDRVRFKVLKFDGTTGEANLLISRVLNLQNGITFTHSFFYDNRFYLYCSRSSFIAEYILEDQSLSIAIKSTALSNAISAGSDRNGNLYMLFHNGAFRRINVSTGEHQDLAPIPNMQAEFDAKPSSLIYYKRIIPDVPREELYFIGGSTLGNFVYFIGSNTWSRLTPQGYDIFNRDCCGSTIIEIEN